MIPKALARGVAALAIGALGAVAHAQAPADAPPAKPRYVLTKTTLEEAKALWAGTNMYITGTGHLALGTGSGIDGYSTVKAERVLLVDVANANFEGVPNARFAFFDNVLYRIQAQLRSGITEDNHPDLLTKDQVKELGTRLLKKYGKPTQQDKYFKVWKLKGNTLIFSDDSLILTNEKVEGDIKKYRKEFCKTVNTKERRTCW